MPLLTQRRILLGITGGIAAYKAAELVRKLRTEGAEVQVVMTEAATRFITPLTLQSLSGRPVRCTLWDASAEAAMEHIELARWAERVVIAPASADFLAKLSSGQADDLLSTVCLATESPIAVVPAMNWCMWQHPATQHNIAVLTGRGVAVWGPEEGPQACGEIGPGRMLAVEEIERRIFAWFAPRSLLGVKVLITAGPTREPMDPVRFLSNRSSGKMGYALAQAAIEAGAEVTLVTGPVALQPPPVAQLVPVESALEMHREVIARIHSQKIFIAAAAVADYTPAQVWPEKIKKDQDRLCLELVKTKDILAEVAGLNNPPFTVGFCAETKNLKESAWHKLRRKGVDMIAANWVGKGVGFEVEDNSLWVLWPGGEQYFPPATKTELARQLVALIVQRYEAKNSAQNPR
ncbi:MAG: bifunctional phosphopantothenoylcysteine decarboxylase/phosphopantothenate--cysteine ligase CoaBC [Methylohalobius sp.]|nr:bifunctional phosphopantothenoylcysteine decarboxylase/phosphopantothenate--cysteine ligase CoaBC [Methylohalobius sp.]